MKFSKVYFEPEVLSYALGKELKEKLKDLDWEEIKSHNSIEKFQKAQNSDFACLKSNLIIGVRKTHKYVENNKISDYLIPYTSSGCSAMCLYCYLVCNYNKCSYMRLFVNREMMLEKIIKKAKTSSKEEVYEIGSNSDLVLENQITGNLKWTIEEFSKSDRGTLTLPTKFHFVDDLLPLNHRGKMIIRMSVNPAEIINKIELRTSSLLLRIEALNKLAEADYKVGLLVAPVILAGDWKKLYRELFDVLAERLSEKTKRVMFIEVIFMTYSYIHKAINNEAFPNAVELYDKSLMGSRGYGKYCYKPFMRNEAEIFIKDELEARFNRGKIRYIS